MHFKNETITKIISNLYSPSSQFNQSLFSQYANRKYAEYLVTEFCKMRRFLNRCRPIPCFSTLLQYVQNSMKASPWATQDTLKQRRNFLALLILLALRANVGQYTELQKLNCSDTLCCTTLLHRAAAKIPGRVFFSIN